MQRWLSPESQLLEGLIPVKVHDTRRQRAAELLRDATNGPSFENFDESITKEQASERYKRWSETWIIPRLKELVPELRPKKGKP